MIEVKEPQLLGWLERKQVSDCARQQGVTFGQHSKTCPPLADNNARVSNTTIGCWFYMLYMRHCNAPPACC
jgi:hypothetical protein